MRLVVASNNWQTTGIRQREREREREGWSARFLTEGTWKRRRMQLVDIRASKMDFSASDTRLVIVKDPLG